MFLAAVQSSFTEMPSSTQRNAHTSAAVLMSAVDRFEPECRAGKRLAAGRFFRTRTIG